MERNKKLVANSAGKENTWPTVLERGWWHTVKKKNRAATIRELKERLPTIKNRHEWHIVAKGKYHHKYCFSQQYQHEQKCKYKYTINQAITSKYLNYFHPCDTNLKKRIATGMIKIFVSQTFNQYV